MAQLFCGAQVLGKVMIAAAAFPKLRRGEFASLEISAQPNLALA